MINMYGNDFLPEPSPHPACFDGVASTIVYPKYPLAVYSKYSKPHGYTNVSSALFRT